MGGAVSHDGAMAEAGGFLAAAVAETDPVEALRLVDALDQVAGNEDWVEVAACGYRYRCTRLVGGWHVKRAKDRPFADVEKFTEMDGCNLSTASLVNKFKLLRAKEEAARKKALRARQPVGAGA